jgi:diguanylate cyclase
VTYAVWYEYLAGLNPALNEELKALIDRGDKLSDAQIEAIYNRHIRKRDDSLEQHARDEFQQLIKDVCQLAREATGNVGNYRDALVSCVTRLEEAQDGNSLQEMLQILIAESLTMRQSMNVLQEQLQERDRQVASLRDSMIAAQDQALTDPLTGLLNRRGFAQALDSALTPEGDAHANPAVLLMVDIDHFKLINDTHGHLMGDKVIRSVAQLLKANVKGRDTVARMGGEEFAVLLLDTPMQGAAHLAEQVRNTIANARFRRTDTPAELGPVTVSIGVAALSPEETPEDFINRADMALYQSKRTGRNKVTLANT